MPFETIEEIKKVVKDQEVIQDLLRKRFETDFDLLVLEPATGVKTGYENYTSSSPRNVFDKISDRLNRAQVTIQIKLAEDATEDARRNASVGELYLFGALADIDRRLRKIGEPPLREGLGWFMGTRGWDAMRCLVYVPKGETKTVFDVVPWDPAQVTFEYGPNGLIWAAYSRTLTKIQVESEFGMTVAGDNNVVIDFWTTEKNSVIVGDAWFKENEDHPVGHVPVYIGAVGSMPTINRNNQGNVKADATLANRGDSVWASSRKLYPFQNKWIGWVMDSAKRAIVASLVHESEDGTAEITGDPYATYQEIKVKKGEKIYPLELPQMPAEAAAAMQVIGQDIEQSTLPSPEAYGSLQGAIPSGRALSILDDATRSKYNPFTGEMANAYTWLCEELLQQFADQKSPTGKKQRLRKTTNVRGYNAKDEFFSVDVKPQQIDTGWFVEVKVEAVLPRDKEGELAQFRSAVSPSGPSGEPALSVGTAREELLHVRDPDAERDKILVEKGMGLPPILAANVAAALKKAGRDELAEQVMMLLRPEGAAGGPTEAPPLPPELIEAIVQVLVQVGQEELASVFVEALGGAPTADEPLNDGTVQEPLRTDL